MHFHKIVRGYLPDDVPFVPAERVARQTPGLPSYAERCAAWKALKSDAPVVVAKSDTGIKALLFRCTGPVRTRTMAFTDIGLSRAERCRIQVAMQLSLSDLLCARPGMTATSMNGTQDQTRRGGQSDAAAQSGSGR
jgi:hypothetical protein